MSQSVRLLFLLGLYSPFNSIAKIPEINVLIGRSLGSIMVSGIDVHKEIKISNLKKTYPGSVKLKFDCESLSTSLKKDNPVLLANLKSQTGLINWNDSRYRGEFSLIGNDSKKSGCDLINRVSLEDYINSLLAKEMRSDWPAEALKAQAVAARTYAYQKIVSKQVSKDLGREAFYDVENSEKHQVTGSFSDETNSTAKATRQTSGEVLTLENGKITPIFFHSKCGGKTLTPDQVWAHAVDGYESVNCPFCHKHGMKPWKVSLKEEEFKKYIDRTLRNFHKDQLASNGNVIKLVPDNKNQSRLRFYEGDELKVVQKSRLRSLLGRNSAPSNYYQIEKKGKEVVLEGKGFGHNVGMCQFGAYELAKRGYNYKQILSHYFPNHKIQKIY